MRVVIGCPIKDRAWIVDRWARCALTAATVAQVDVEFVLVTHPEDDETLEAIEDALGDTGLATTVPSEELGAVVYRRDWSTLRFSQMTELRNRLLREVRDRQPDLFWSLDSDILAHPDALCSSIKLIEERHFDAVGQCCFMSHLGLRHPSYAMLSAAGGLQRPFQPGQFAVDVIMAAKVMTPAAYAIDYGAHRQGEDLGWCRAARGAGLKLGWDGTVISKHVMNRDDLDVVDERCGY